MEDIADKITKLLEDDNSVNMIKTLTSSLGGKQDSPSPDLSKLVNIASGFKDDDRIGLVKALRPFVSDKKKESLDSAVNILRIIRILSLMGYDIKF